MKHGNKVPGTINFQKKLREKKQEWKNRQEEDTRFSSCFVKKILLHKYNESTYNKNIKRR